MAILPTNLELTDKDFDALRVRLISLIKSVFPDWSDFEVAGFGNLLIELYAFVGDVLTYYMDNLARESRLVTATQRKNVIALARMLGYQLYGAHAATADEVFSITGTLAARVIIPAGTVVRTKEVTEPIRFQLLSDVQIPTDAIDPQVTATVEHSKTYTQLFDSTGLSGTDILLDYTPYLDDSAIITAGNGSYTEQTSLLNSGPNDRHFMVLVDQNDRATVRFGDGVSGAVPTGTIQVIYKTGGGSVGNVEAGAISVLEGSFTDNYGNPVQVMVTNPKAASGGSERQTMASAKLLAPESLRAVNRTVAREDFEINARQVSGVARALMLTSNEDVSIKENSGVLFVVPQGGGTPTQTLKDAVYNEVTVVKPHTLTFKLSVQDPVYKEVDVEARIYLRQGYDPTTVRDQVKTNLAAWFQISNDDGTPNENIDFGFNIKDANGDPVGEVALSDIFNVIRDTEGVRKIGDKHGDLKLNSLPSDVSLQIQELPILGEVSLINGDTGGYL